VYNLSSIFIGSNLSLYEKLKNLFDKNLEKKTKMILMIVYAVMMFSAIQSQINTIMFILLFAVLPIGIYFYVKSIFPKN
jgi:uncharacterized membrane protein